HIGGGIGRDGRGRRSGRGGVEHLVSFGKLGRSIGSDFGWGREGWRSGSRQHSRGVFSGGESGRNAVRCCVGRCGGGRCGGGRLDRGGGFLIGGGCLDRCCGSWLGGNAGLGVVGGIAGCCGTRRGRGGGGIRSEVRSRRPDVVAGNVL